MKMKILAPLAALALAAGAASTAQAAATITTSFDTGKDGWDFGSYQGFRGQPLTWDAATQTITRSHGFGGFGFLASQAYLGDKSDYLGGVFSFDLAASIVDLAYADRSALVLQGAGKTIFARPGAPPGAGLTPFAFTLKASNFYAGNPDQISGNVSAADFEAVLADLDLVQVMGDWTANFETVRLDNVKLAAAAGVPEPATWALMILGFGGAGAALRRRRSAAATA